MEVIVAKSAGFCFGVKRAVDTVYEQTQKRKKTIYTYGPIIHNEEVVNDLAQKGVKIIESKETLAECKDGIVVIRSHGVAKEIYDLLEKHQIEYVDATCPFVLKIHRYVQKHTKEGDHIVIIGSASHPEVEGIRGWGEKNAISVISSHEEAEKFEIPDKKRITIVAQTTFNNKKFQEIVEIIEKKSYHNINVLNTICNATHERQKEARELAAKADAMIVIGGRQSSNTQKLFEICNKECENTYYIQTLKDLDVTSLQSIGIVGITAGASTPNKIIEEVQKNVRNEF